jgi:hypothetical protein
VSGCVRRLWQSIMWGPDGMPLLMITNNATAVLGCVAGIVVLHRCAAWLAGCFSGSPD